MKADIREIFMNLEAEMCNLQNVLSKGDNYEQYHFTRDMLILLKNNLLAIFTMAKEEGRKNGDIDV